MPDDNLLAQIFMHKSAMQMHAREMQRINGPEVNKPHQCQQCLKSFSSNHQLVQHIRVHTGEKPYKCSYCERRFKQLSHVQQHTRLHTGKFCITLLHNVLITCTWRLFLSIGVLFKILFVKMSPMRKILLFLKK